MNTFLKGCFALIAGLTIAFAAKAEPTTTKNGSVELTYEVLGPADAPPILLINGLGVATRFGAEPLADALVERGMRVIVFDNRDTGRSTELREAGAPPSMEELGAGKKPAYTLSDMAGDAVAVLDAAGVERAHVAGHSLGGMITQVMASDYPDRMLSMILMSTTTGQTDLELGPAMEAMSQEPPAGEAAQVEQAGAAYRAFDGTDLKMSEAEIDARVAADRAIKDPNAAGRQGAAATANGDRREALAQIKLPTLVTHGTADPLFPLTHAESLVKSVPGSKLVAVEGLGHMISDPAAPQIADAISSFVKDLPQN